MLVAPSDKTDPIWIDGQRAALTMAIMAVVHDNVNHPEYQNLSNARQFVAKMCTPGPNGIPPIVYYLRNCPKDHPAQMAVDIANIAPAKTRGSFYTSALVTLDLFTDPTIHSMTSATDFDHTATGTRKRAIFIILPDDRSTYYSLASLFTYQHYQTLSEVSLQHGNRLPIRTNFICDEFGNFTKIPEFSTLFTVGAGRGIRFHLFLQDFSQLVAKYGGEVAKTIRTNAATWLYLSSKDASVQEEISKMMGNYTTKSSGMSGSSGGQTSANYNLISRPLLTPDEISHITPNFFSVRLLSGRWGIYQRRRKHRGALDCRQLLKELVADQVKLPAALEPGRYRAVTHDTVLRRLRRMENARNLVVTPVYMADMKRIHAAMVGKRCKKCRERCPFPAQDTPRQFYDIRFEIIKTNEKGVRW